MIPPEDVVHVANICVTISPGVEDNGRVVLTGNCGRRCEPRWAGTNNQNIEGVLGHGLHREVKNDVRKQCRNQVRVSYTKHPDNEYFCENIWLPIFI